MLESLLVIRLRTHRLRLDGRGGRRVPWYTPAEVHWLVCVVMKIFLCISFNPLLHYPHLLFLQVFWLFLLPPPPFTPVPPPSQTGGDESGLRSLACSLTSDLSVTPSCSLPPPLSLPSLLPSTLLFSPFTASPSALLSLSRNFLRLSFFYFF